MHQLQFFPYGLHLIVKVDNSFKCYKTPRKNGVRHILVMGKEDYVLDSPLPRIFDTADHKWKEIDEFKVEVKASIVLDKELGRVHKLDKGVYTAYELENGHFVFYLHKSDFDFCPRRKNNDRHNKSPYSQ